MNEQKNNIKRMYNEKEINKIKTLDKAMKKRSNIKKTTKIKSINNMFSAYFQNNIKQLTGRQSVIHSFR